MPNPNIKLYFGKKTELPKASTQGHLLFTVEPDDLEGKAEAHIYFDNGNQLVELYGEDLAALKALIGETPVATQLENLYNSSKTIEKSEQGSLEVKISSKEGNILHKDEETNGLYVLPGEGIDYTVKVTTDSTTAGMSKTYTIKQGKDEKEVGKIDIPKDLVVASGTIEVIEDYQDGSESRDGVTTNGTYLVLTLANDEAKKVYILVDKLCDVYSGKDGTSIKVDVSDLKEISAEVKAGSIDSEKLAENAVTDGKIAADAVTEAAIKNSAVTNDKIADSTIAEGKLDAQLAKKINDSSNGLLWGTFSDLAGE